VGGTLGYPERYRLALEPQVGVPIDVINLACSGCTTADLLSSLQDNPRFRDSVARSQIVSWNIGGNDLLAARGAYVQGQCGGPDGQGCLRDTVARFERNWDAIVDELAALTAGHPAVTVTMDIYDPFAGTEAGLGGGPALLAVFLPYLDEVNAHIGSTAAAHRMEVAPVHAAFNGPNGREDPIAKGLMAPDVIHPADPGHQRLADLLLETSRDPIAELQSALGGAPQ